MDPAKLSILKDQLYESCRNSLDGEDEKAYQKVFSQEDLLGMGIIGAKDLKALAMVIKELTYEYLFITVNTTYGAAWRLRPEEEANKYSGLSEEQTIIYALIDNAGAEGIWQQDLRKKTNMRDQTVKKVLKELENQKKLITSFTSVQQVSHRCYIKASIKPSEKATGGPWFADGDLDESFIESLLAVAYHLIKTAGSYRSLGGPGGRAPSTSPVLPKKVLNGTQSEAAITSRGKKRSADSMDDHEESSPGVTSKSRKGPGQPTMLPLPAGFKNYLTLPELTQKIASSNVTRGLPLKEPDIQQLVDVLIYDGRIELIKIGKRVGYRAVRITKANPGQSMKLEDDLLSLPSNGLTTAPCGRCPVFDLCEEGGPVWAGGCEYFDQWLV